MCDISLAKGNILHFLPQVDRKTLGFILPFTVKVVTVFTMEVKYAFSKVKHILFNTQKDD